jgi:outer membrane immunogenic protein
MMKTPLLALALATASALPTLAADLPYRKGPPPVYTPPVPLFTWTGFYVGVNGGGIMSQSSRAFTTADPTGGFAPLSYRNRDNGFLGGGQIGYNWQMGAFVAGLEADFDGTSLGRTDTVAGLAGVTGTFRDKLDWLGTARARLGFTPMERLLIYGTGGLAFGETDLTHSLTVPGAGTFTGSNSDVRTGWTLGAGGEWAFTQNWSAKVEYLYYDLGKKSVTAFTPGGPSSVSANERGSIIRAGLNYKFW